MLSSAVTFSCLLSAAMAGALPNKRQESSSSTGATCMTEMGSVSLTSVPSTTTTITTTNQVVYESTTIPITTETPDAVTVISTDYATETETVTDTTVTDTFSTTSTDFTTTTTTSTVTATFTTTTETSTTTTVAINAAPSGTFYDAYDTLDGYPSTGSKVKRSKCKHDPEAQSSSTYPSASAGFSLIYNTTQPTAYSMSSSSATVATFSPEQTISVGGDSTPEDSGFYAAEVSCSTTVEVVTTSTVISTGAPITVTATADTTSSTITSTITTTSTVVPDDVSTTLSFSETATITETAMVTTTVTTTTTNTNTATSTTSGYSICTDSANILLSPFTDPAGHTVEIWQFTSTASYSLAVGDASSQVACCNSCAALGTACAMSYFNSNGNGICYMLKPVAAYTKQSAFHMNVFTRTSLSGTKLGVANGEGGYVLESFSG
ncbi:hypothetical protein BJ166DRAFT_542819 [Pestalotiopsis sp. NC0098]|nr:hypothetical protein BJ166DRAFT_542819 [Pestalotiopsis sp. NC0098]